LRTADSGEPIPYATISVFTQEDSLMAGSLSSDNGQFNLMLPFGTYQALVEFMGYGSYRTNPFTLTGEDAEMDLGILTLSVQARNLEEVEVRAERTLMQLALDKRIFHVGKDLANAGGTASDVLMNLPSIAVDPEGNVRLRGSSDVRILIDGKPSGLVSFKGSNGLRQLPATLVERVEVITNPSAKYEAEGMAGVINIILKKDKAQGFNGSFEIIGGIPLNQGITSLLNYRKNKLNGFIHYGLSRRINPSVGTLYQEVYSDSLPALLSQRNQGKMDGLNNNVRAGLDYFFSEQSHFNFSYVLRRSDAKRITDIRYEDCRGNLNNFLGYSLRRQEETEQEPNSEIILSYRKNYPRKGHELHAAFTFLDYWENSDQLFTQASYSPGGSVLLAKNLIQTSLNDEFEKQYLLQLDYVKPFSKEGKLETGFRTSFRNMENDYVVKEKDADGRFKALPGLDNLFLYKENIGATYFLLGNKIRKLGYQAGLRAEYTDVQTTLWKTAEINPRQYGNLFPSAHLSWQVSDANALQLSYSRRIRRPVYNDLSPYVTFSDARNFFSGNPDLNPEFTDAFELGSIRQHGKGTFLANLFYRDTRGKIDRIRTVKSDGFSVTIPYNLIGEQAFGVEFTADYRIRPWWKTDFNLNLFEAHINGSNVQENYTAIARSFLLRHTSRFTPKNGWDVQMRINHEGRQRTAQGIRKSITFTDISASRKLFRDKGTLILNVLDLFNGRRNRYITRGTNFFTEGDFQGVRRQVNLTFNYRLRD